MYHYLPASSFSTLSSPSSSSSLSSSNRLLPRSTSSSTPRARRVSSYADDLGSVLFAVAAFLSIGVLLFIACFCVTKMLQCYKSHLRRKRRREIGEDQSDGEVYEEEEEYEEEAESDTREFKEDGKQKGIIPNHDHARTRVVAGGVELSNGRKEEERGLVRNGHPQHYTVFPA